MHGRRVGGGRERRRGRMRSFEGGSRVFDREKTLYIYTSLQSLDFVVNEVCRNACLS